MIEHKKIILNNFLSSSFYIFNYRTELRCLEQERNGKACDFKINSSSLST